MEKEFFCCCFANSDFFPNREMVIESLSFCTAVNNELTNPKSSTGVW